MIKAVIFDMDGVIVETHSAGLATMHFVVDKYFGVTPTHEEEQYYLGSPDREFYRDLIKDHAADVSLEQLLSEQFARYESHLREEVAILPGVSELINELQSDYRLGLCTGSTRNQVNIILEKTNLVNVFEFIVTCDDTEHGKPNPEGYAKILTDLNIAPEEAVVIEDSPAGIQAALGAGIKVIGIDNNLNQDVSKATNVIKKIEEVLPIIKQSA